MKINRLSYLKIPSRQYFPSILLIRPYPFVPSLFLSVHGCTHPSPASRQAACIILSSPPCSMQANKQSNVCKSPCKQSNACNSPCRPPHVVLPFYSFHLCQILLFRENQLFILSKHFLKDK
uniref:Uncharacterized protein n=1 Tax=Oryza brachyantha TaxID=4533 RepID=J3MFA7_ORYBR